MVYKFGKCDLKMERWSIEQRYREKKAQINLVFDTWLQV